DHLGSASYITEDNGNPTQQIVYLPFGEDWVDIKYNTQKFETPYKFNGKEKDEETSYNYYGARYYYDHLSIFLSVDPMSDKYPHLSPYAYCANNPIMLIDPNGEDIIIAGDDGNNYKYKDRKLFLNGEEYTGNDKFATTSRDHLNKLKDNGMNDEISGMESSSNTHKMIKGIENKWTPNSDKDASNGKGTGSTINYNPDLQSNDGWDRSPEVGLAHEIQHASDGDLGKYDNSTVELSRPIGIGYKVDSKYSNDNVDIKNANLPGTNMVIQILRKNFERGEFKAIKTANKVNQALGGKVNRTKINGF
ncbi:MAG: RHS repeat-associated core domain-containing protein, partial [Bacteroidales bacterium]